METIPDPQPVHVFKDESGKIHPLIPVQPYSHLRKLYGEKGLLFTANGDISLHSEKLDPLGLLQLFDAANGIIEDNFRRLSGGN